MGCSGSKPIPQNPISEMNALPSPMVASVEKKRNVADDCTFVAPEIASDVQAQPAGLSMNNESSEDKTGLVTEGEMLEIVEVFSSVEVNSTILEDATTNDGYDEQEHPLLKSTENEPKIGQLLIVAPLSVENVEVSEDFKSKEIHEDTNFPLESTEIIDSPANLLFNKFFELIIRRLTSVKNVKSYLASNIRAMLQNNVFMSEFENIETFSKGTELNDMVELLTRKLSEHEQLFFNETKKEFILVPVGQSKNELIELYHNSATTSEVDSVPVSNETREAADTNQGSFDINSSAAEATKKSKQPRNKQQKAAEEMIQLIIHQLTKNDHKNADSQSKVEKREPKLDFYLESDVMTILNLELLNVSEVARRSKITAILEYMREDNRLHYIRDDKDHLNNKFVLSDSFIATMATQMQAPLSPMRAKSQQTVSPIKSPIKTPINSSSNKQTTVITPTKTNPQSQQKSKLTPINNNTNTTVSISAANNASKPIPATVSESPATVFTTLPGLSDPVAAATTNVSPLVSKSWMSLVLQAPTDTEDNNSNDNTDNIKNSNSNSNTNSNNVQSNTRTPRSTDIVKPVNITTATATTVEFKSEHEMILQLSKKISKRFTTQLLYEGKEKIVTTVIQSEVDNEINKAVIVGAANTCVHNSNSSSNSININGDISSSTNSKNSSTNIEGNKVKVYDLIILHMKSDKRLLFVSDYNNKGLAAFTKNSEINTSNVSNTSNITVRKQNNNKFDNNNSNNYNNNKNNGNSNDDICVSGNNKSTINNSNNNSSSNASKSVLNIVPPTNLSENKKQAFSIAVQKVAYFYAKKILATTTPHYVTQFRSQFESVLNKNFKNEAAFIDIESEVICESVINILKNNKKIDYLSSYKNSDKEVFIAVFDAEKPVYDTKTIVSNAAVTDTTVADSDNGSGKNKISSNTSNNLFRQKQNSFNNNNSNNLNNNKSFTNNSRFNNNNSTTNSNNTVNTATRNDSINNTNYTTSVFSRQPSEKNTTNHMHTLPAVSAVLDVSAASPTYKSATAMAMENYKQSKQSEKLQEKLPEWY